MATDNTVLTDDMLTLPFVVDGMRVSTPIYETKVRPSEYSATAVSPFCFSVEKKSAKKAKVIAFDLENCTITDDDGNDVDEKSLTTFFRDLDTNLYVGEPSCVRYIISGLSNTRKLYALAKYEWSPLQLAVLRNRDFGICIDGCDYMSDGDGYTTEKGYYEIGSVTQEDVNTVLPIIMEALGRDATISAIKSCVIKKGEHAAKYLILNMDAAVYMYRNFCGESPKIFKHFVLMWASNKACGGNFPRLSTLEDFNNRGEWVYGGGTRRDGSLFDYLDGRMEYAESMPIVSRTGSNQITARGGVEHLCEYIVNGFANQRAHKGAYVWNGVKRQNEAYDYEAFFRDWAMLMYWKSQFGEDHFDLYPNDMAEEMTACLEKINGEIDSRVFRSLVEKAEIRDGGKAFSLPVEDGRHFSSDLYGCTVTNCVSAESLREMADKKHMYYNGTRPWLWMPFAFMDMKMGNNDPNMLSVRKSYDRFLHDDAQLVAVKAGDGTLIALAIVVIDESPLDVHAYVGPVLKNNWFNGRISAAIEGTVRKWLNGGH